MTWWQQHGRRFAMTTIAVATVLLAIALLVGLDDVLRGVWVALSGFLLLPFAVLLALLSVLIVPVVIILVFSALADDTALIEGVGEVGGEIVVAPYYRFLGRQRNPIFWGIPAGVFAATAILGGIAYVRDAPVRRAHELEAQQAEGTKRSLVQASEQIAATFRDTGHLPEQLAMNDGYGRPLTYRFVAGHLKHSYTVTSLGRDPVLANDDICIDGEHRAHAPSAKRWAVSRLLNGKEPTHITCPRRR